MTEIRIKDLPEDLNASPAADFLPVDGGSTRRVRLDRFANIVRPFASQAEAEAGLSETKTSTPQRVSQQISARIASQAEAEAGTNGDKLMTPLRTAQQIDARVASEAEAQAGTSTTKLLSVERGMDLITARGAEAAFTPSGTGAVTTTVAKALDERGYAGITRTYSIQTVADLLADTVLGYSGTDITVTTGDIVEAEGFRYEVAASGASDQHVTTAGGVKLYVLPVHGSIDLTALAIVAGSEASAAANKTTLAVAYTAATRASVDKVIFGTKGTYWFPTKTQISATGITLDLNGSTLKQASGSHTTNWLIANGHSGFSLKNGKIDGNRVGAASLHPDSCLIIAGNATDLEFDNLEIFASSAKGLGIASGVSPSTGTKRVRVTNCVFYDCAVQCVLTDRSNGTGDDTIPCEDIIFDRIFVRDTDHAGIAINDGTRRVTVSNCILDVNNTTWDALAIRGSRQVTVTNTIGRRGRNGCQVLLLDAAALSRNEDARDIVFSGNIWAENDQYGLNIVGAENVSVTGDIAKNNRQGGVAGTGFNVNQTAGVRRAKAITLASVVAIDDQGTPTQTDGITIGATDKVGVTAPVIYGNTTTNYTKVAADVTEVSVVGDGPDGALIKRVSASTGSLAAGASALINLPFTTPFNVEPNHVVASVLVGTSGIGIRVDHVAAINVNQAQVRVTNARGVSLTGTIYAEVSYLA